MSHYVTYFLYAIVGIWVYRLLAYYFDSGASRKVRKGK